MVNAAKIGTKRISDQGYVLVYNPEHPTADKSGWAREHRMLWFDAYGSIPEKHDIHHKNENRADNRLNNLECLSKSDHSKLHYPSGPQAGCKRNISGLLAAHKLRCEQLNAKTVWMIKLCSHCRTEIKLKLYRVRQKQKRYANIFCSTRCKGKFTALKRRTPSVETST